MKEDSDKQIYEGFAQLSIMGATGRTLILTSGKIWVAAVETTRAPYCGPSLVCLFVPGGYCIYGRNST